METKQFRVTFTLNFDIDATSEEVAFERAESEALEWIQSVSCIEAKEITIVEV